MDEIMGMPGRKRPALEWEFGNGRNTLREGTLVLLEMTSRAEGGALFSSGLEHWVVRDIGFWNPRTVVEQHGAPVAVMSRGFVGSKAWVDMSDGRRYLCRVHSRTLVRLSIHNAGGVQVLHYRLDPGSRPPVVFEVRNTWISRPDLLILIMLGFHAFQGIRREHRSADLDLLPSTVNGSSRAHI